MVIEEPVTDDQCLWNRECDLTVNMTAPARINIIETGINLDGEGTESMLPDDVLDWIPV